MSEEETTPSEAPAPAEPPASPAEDQPAPKKRGRPRSESARRAILAATWDILMTDGYDSVTADGIAHRAGVSKATIYKWWPSKAAVALDCFLEIVHPQINDPDLGDVRSELAVPALDQIRLFRDTPIGRVMVSLIGTAQSDPELAEAFRTRWLGPRREKAIEAVHRAQARGQLRDDVDGHFVLDMIFGPIYYRLLAGHQPLPDELVGQLVDAVLDGLSPAPTPAAG